MSGDGRPVVILRSLMFGVQLGAPADADSVDALVITAVPLTVSEPETLHRFRAGYDDLVDEINAGNSVFPWSAIAPPAPEPNEPLVGA